jgi:hypothetical protein
MSSCIVQYRAKPVSKETHSCTVSMASKKTSKVLLNRSGSGRVRVNCRCQLAPVLYQVKGPTSTMVNSTAQQIGAILFVSRAAIDMTVALVVAKDGRYRFILLINSRDCG